MARKAPAKRKAALGGTRKTPVAKKATLGGTPIRKPPARPSADKPVGKRKPAKTKKSPARSGSRGPAKSQKQSESRAPAKSQKRSDARAPAKSSQRSGSRAPAKSTQRTAPRSPAKAPARTASDTARITRVAAAAGSLAPVTLEEAQALALARAPRRSAMATTKPAAAAPSPAPIGEAREDVEVQREQERRRRIDEYTATMNIMKSRGARRRGAAAAPAFRPLQVMAEGDSWFDYPYPTFGGGIVKRLQKRLGVPILNLAEAGDEVRFMLGVKQRARLVRSLREGCPAGGPWDVLLFSGGGNDIVDNPMALWVKDWKPGTEAADHLHQARFDTALALVRAGYEDLIALRDALSPDTHLVFHGYDFALPDGRGACHLGPWLKPTFDLRGFPSQAAGAAVVRRMLEQFAAMLDQLAVHPRVTVIKTQGTLPATPASWHNELHPAKKGFDTFADLFRDTLGGLFPDRVA